MTPEEAIVTVLEQIPGLKHKVYPMEALKNARDRFVFYRQTAWDVEDLLLGDSDLQSATFEVHCVAKSYADLVSLAGHVRLALQAMQGNTYGDLFVERAKVRQASPDLNEREVNLMRRAYALQLEYQGGTEI